MRGQLGTLGRATQVSLGPVREVSACGSGTTCTMHQSEHETENTGVHPDKHAAHPMCQPKHETENTNAPFTIYRTDMASGARF